MGPWKVTALSEHGFEFDGVNVVVGKVLLIVTFKVFNVEQFMAVVSVTDTVPAPAEFPHKTVIRFVDWPELIIPPVIFQL